MKKLENIKNLDGIRALAVLIVCFAHFFQVNENYLYSDSKYLGIFLFKFSQIGLNGVNLFFILSGFLITRILLNSKDSKNYFKTFYLRRLIRIFPLYYLVLILSFFILPYFIGIDEPGKNIISNQIWLWSYTSNLSSIFFFSGWDLSLNFPSFGHFWSLCVEEHFYIFWPFLIYFMSIKNLKKSLKIILICSFLLFLFNKHFDSQLVFLKWSSIKYSGILSLGGLIAIYDNSSIKSTYIYSISKKTFFPLLFVFLISSLIIPRNFLYFDFINIIFSSLFFSVLIICAINKNKVIEYLFNNRILSFIGKLSYGIYVYHGLIRPYLSKYILPQVTHICNESILTIVVYTIISTLISIIIAYVSWILIEKQFLKLKTKFDY